MFEIAKAGRGNWRYYSTIPSLDREVVNFPEPSFTGELAERFGLTERAVSEKDFKQLYEGRWDGKKVIQSAGTKRHRPMWDIVFRPRKDVQIFWALNERLSSKIERAHMSAVMATLKHIEKNTPLVRRSVEKKQLFETVKLAFYVQSHGTARPTKEFPNDPDFLLHTHCGLLNMGLTASQAAAHITNPKYHALHSGVLFKKKREYTAVYRQHLGQELQKIGIGIEWTNKKQNDFEIVSIDNRMLDREFIKALGEHFSKRHQEIQGTTESERRHSALFDRQEKIERSEFLKAHNGQTLRDRWKEQALTFDQNYAQRLEGYADSIEARWKFARTERDRQEIFLQVVKEAKKDMAERQENVAASKAALKTAELDEMLTPKAAPLSPEEILEKRKQAALQLLKDCRENIALKMAEKRQSQKWSITDGY